MGIFDRVRGFSESRRSSRMEKATRVASNPKASKEDRMASLQLLASLDDGSEAVKRLLPRFNFSLEHGIIDTREKEVAMTGILRFEKSAIPMLQDWIKASSKIAWPIKILKKLGSDEEVVDVLKSALVFEDVSFDQGATDKNYDILCYLRDYKLGDFSMELVKLIQASDERVRFACVEALIEQRNQELAPALEHFMVDHSSENIRIRQSVIKAFQELSWKVSNVGKIAEAAEGIHVLKDGTIRVHG